MDALDASSRSPIMLGHHNQKDGVVRVLLKRGAVLPESLESSAEMGELVKEVERERLQDMVKEEQDSGNASNLMIVAEREFEDCRQRLLELSKRAACARAAPAVTHLETMLANVTADYRLSKQADAEYGKEAKKYRDLLAGWEAKKAQAEKDMKFNLNRAATAKQSMIKKQGEVVDMRKKLLEVKSSLQKSKARGAALDDPLREARAKVDSAKDDISRYEQEHTRYSKRLAEVLAKIAEWDAMRAEAAALHQQSQDLLSREPGSLFLNGSSY